jgi:hypothetical protein
LSHERLGEFADACDGETLPKDLDDEMVRGMHVVKAALALDYDTHPPAKVLGDDIHALEDAVSADALLLVLVSEAEAMLVLFALPQRRRQARGDAQAEPKLASTMNVENSILIIRTSGNWMEKAAAD